MILKLSHPVFSCLVIYSLCVWITITTISRQNRMLVLTSTTQCTVARTSKSSRVIAQV